MFHEHKNSYLIILALFQKRQILGCYTGACGAFNSLSRTVHSAIRTLTTLNCVISILGVTGDCIVSVDGLVTAVTDIDRLWRQAL
jgi:hypothetical protein